MPAGGWIAVIVFEVLLLVATVWAFFRIVHVHRLIQTQRPEWLTQLRQRSNELREVRRRVEGLESQAISIESIGGVGPKWIGIRLLLKMLIRHGAAARS